VLRLYDPVEADRSYQTGDRHVLLVLDEGDRELVDPVMGVVAEECIDAGAEVLDDGLVATWMEHRNDVSALEALITRGYVVDTMEIAARWSALPAIYEAATAAIGAVEHTSVASAHLSHSYPDGACLYFTFAGKPEAGDRETYYRAAWDAGTRAVLERGGALSHHHGVGLNRARFVRDALGNAFDVLTGVKAALDPNGILNPGKLGLPDPWGDPGWPP
jgi:alkyldihydroxyacetonephosphate synthase